MKFKIGTMCGAKWYRRSDWKLYGFFHVYKHFKGFRIGPILFWDGS